MTKNIIKTKKISDRFDYNDLGLDDVVVNDVEMFRLERMDDDTFWARCYKNNGKIIDFNFYIEKGKMKVLMEKFKNERKK